MQRYSTTITKHVHKYVPSILSPAITWRLAARCNNELQGLVS